MKQNDDREFFAEIGILAQVRHPHIVQVNFEEISLNFLQYYGIAKIENEFYIVMEWMPLGSLKSIIKEIDLSEFTNMYPFQVEIKLKSNQVYSILNLAFSEEHPFRLLDFQLESAAQCAAGMMHLSQKKILHRDIALRNVLMAKTDEGGYRAKMSDFGMARSTAGIFNLKTT